MTAARDEPVDNEPVERDGSSRRRPEPSASTERPVPAAAPRPTTPDPAEAARLEDETAMHRGDQDPVDRERRKREVEEVRRSFTAVGRRLGTLGQQRRFSTVNPVAVQPEARSAKADPAPPAPPAALELPTVQPVPRRPTWPLAAVVLGLIFAVGVLLGRGIGDARPAPASRATPATITRTVTRSVVPPSCLTAVQRADEAIHLLVARARDQRLSDSLTSYAAESRACRKAAPEPG